MAQELAKSVTVILYFGGKLNSSLSYLIITVPEFTCFVPKIVLMFRILFGTKQVNLDKNMELSHIYLAVK